MPQPPSLRPPPRIESDRGTGISDPVQDPQATQGHRPRPWVVGLIGALIITLAVVVVVLPKMVDPSDEETALGEPTTADDPALRTPPPLIEENATNPILNGLNRSLDEALLQGRSALIARDPEAAAAAFHRASILDPERDARDLRCHGFHVEALDDVGANVDDGEDTGANTNDDEETT